jgi:hypothetical protein
MSLIVSGLRVDLAVAEDPIARLLSWPKAISGGSNFRIDVLACL